MSRHQAPDIDIPEEKFLLDYYEPFTALLHAPQANLRRETFNNIDFVVVSLDGADIRIGLATSILAMIEQGNFKRLYELFPPQPDSTDIHNRRKLGKDGILIELGRNWDQQQMAKEPTDRSRKL